MNKAVGVIGILLAGIVGILGIDFILKDNYTFPSSLEGLIVILIVFAVIGGVVAVVRR
tara:strand:+ start:48 stop:221 length:174 start_codon:yes stop_codon:yes gene_type:complete